MRITSKGQVTIPQKVREEAGLMPGTEVEFAIEKGRVVLRKAQTPKKPTRGQAAVDRHAAVSGLSLLTRDPRRYQSSFPAVRMIAPEG